MQTNITEAFLATTEGQRANTILRKCVHCGFCNATCPTYQLLGDELDGPRGRIYQIKQLLEGQTTSRETQSHLDRCLTCRNCETTCPSGVDYGELLGIGRELIEKTVKRSRWDRFKRWCIRETLAYPKRFNLLLSPGQIIRPLFPGAIRKLIPERRIKLPWPQTSSDTRKMLLLQGCVQPTLSPAINHAAATVLDRLNIQVIEETPAACCGALHHHTSAQDEALNFIRYRIDAWWPHVENGIEAIVSTASGCGVHIKDYGQLLAEDKQYKDKAAKISSLVKDIAEIINQEDLSGFQKSSKEKIAYHPPCTLQHGQKLPGIVEGILTRLGIGLDPVNDSHLCCGSAGSYSLLNPKLADQVGQNKVKNLMANQPDLIVTANIGCLHHLDAKSSIPVKHWIELLV
jgi:glycolate oxidase iron-sulfur subunit